MINKISKRFGVKPSKLKAAGVFDAYIGIDNKLFVDPVLLKTAKTPEFQGARKKLEGYFADVIRLIEASDHTVNAAWKEAFKRLLFHEIHAAALGYSNVGGHGNAIGPELAERLLKRSSEIIKLGVKDPVIFELIGLFEEDFGADRLSDMTVAILVKEFLEYTQRMTRELDLKPRHIFPVGSSKYELPLHPNGKSPLLLVPNELLDVLPVALDPSEIDHVKAFNDRLRIKFNELFAIAAKERRRPTKAEIRETFFSTPGGLETLVDVYRKATGKPYDLEKDPWGLVSWEEIGRSFAQRYSLLLTIKAPTTVADVRSTVGQIVRQFKKNIEQNRLYEVLYDDEGNPRREIYSQRVFYALADAYCEANDVDLNREPNAGNGPVDFKVSSGYHARVLVEIKLSSNTHLVKGFTDQLPAYEKSESTEESVLVILRVTESDSSIQDVLKIRRDAVRAGKKVPEIVVIDARPSKAASKR
jgi:hypothetical protein